VVFVILIVTFSYAGSLVYNILTRREFNDDLSSTSIVRFTCIKCDNNNLLRLLDASGKEVYRSRIKVYCRKADIAVIFVDSTNQDSIDRIDTWVEFAKDNCDSKGVPFILVSTKTDIESAGDNLARIREKAGECGMELCFISAKTGDGIENLGELLVNTATRIVAAGATRIKLDRAIRIEEARAAEAGHGAAEAATAATKTETTATAKAGTPLLIPPLVAKIIVVAAGSSGGRSNRAFDGSRSALCSKVDFLRIGHDYNLPNIVRTF
jgi:hypothetical protein